MRHNYQNLPADDNLNRFSFSTEVNGETIVRAGAMIAYYGQLRFESISSNGLSAIIKQALNAPSFLSQFMGVTGRGKLVLADNGNDISSFTVEDATFTLKTEHVLGFAPTLKCQESTLPGYVTLIGSGRLLASSNGPVVFLEPPCRVDPDAVLGWADMPSPSYRYDHGYVRGILGAMGAISGLSASGEEKQLDFYGKGTVLVQSSEMPLGGRSPLTSVLAQLSGLHQTELQQVAQRIMAMTHR